MNEKLKYTKEEVDEIVEEAVAKVKRSFGHTFKRLNADISLLTEQVEDLSQIAILTQELNSIDIRIKDLIKRVQGKWGLK